ncbi:hypothetical protein D3C87_1556100 [compost metagenome]
MCAASSSPATSLSRTAAQLASFVGTIVIPYFLAKPFSAAITNGAQSVKGIKPTRTVSSSGLSEPAAHAECMTPGSSIAPPAIALACKNRRLVQFTMLTPEKKPKKSARQCRSIAGRLYPENERTAVGASLKFVNVIMQSGCQVLTP